MHPVEPGTTLHDLAPHPTGLLVCRVNGSWLLREHWHLPVQPGDVVEWYDVPQDKGVQRLVLTIAAAYFLGPAGAGLQGTAFVAANVAATLAINALIPATPPPGATGGAAASPTYSTSLAGNQARLHQPIPKVCGRHKITPPFAAQPYQEFDANGDQYYYALLVVGVGQHDIERALIDDTPLSHFQDVLVAQYLAPGVLPTTVLPNVVTAPEVAGQELRSGQYVGGFAACSARDSVAQLGIDVIAPRGLGSASGGGFDPLSVQWRVETRRIDSFGQAISAWTVLANETRSAATNTQQRWSTRYTVTTPTRLEVRVVRVDVKIDSNTVLHELQWSGLRAYLTTAAPLNQHTAHYEVVLRASEQLSALTQRNITLIAQAKVRTWSPAGGGTWGAAVHTRNPAWWLADLWTSTTWGEGLADSRVDLQTLYDLSLEWEARQDRFDHVFDTATSAWEAAQLIARSGRARVFRRQGVRSLARDALAELPVTAFTPRNTTPASMVMSERLPTRDTPDGVIVEYFDNRSWKWLNLDCPSPGVVSMAAPVRMRLPGITGAKHATREGLYEAAALLYRRRTVQCTTEMQGMLPACMSPVRWLPEIPGYGQSGDVADWNAGTKVMTLSEPPTFGASNYLTLLRDDGSLTTPVAVLPGPTEFDVTLPAVPDFAIVLNDGERERPKYLFGSLDGCDELVRISSIGDGGQASDGAQLYSIAAEVDDARVHAADNALLPGPGEVQDPVDAAAEVDTGGGTLVLVAIEAHTVYATPGPAHTAPNFASYTLGSNGVASYAFDATPDFGSGSGNYAGEWFVYPQEVSVAALFEAQATVVLLNDPDATGAYFTGTFGSWLNLGTTRTWRVDVPAIAGQVDAIIRVEIREASTGIVQDSALITLYDTYEPLNP